MCSHPLFARTVSALSHVIRNPNAASALAELQRMGFTLCVFEIAFRPWCGPAPESRLPASSIDYFMLSRKRQGRKPFFEHEKVRVRLYVFLPTEPQAWEDTFQELLDTLRLTRGDIITWAAGRGNYFTIDLTRRWHILIIGIITNLERPERLQKKYWPRNNQIKQIIFKFYCCSKAFKKIISCYF